MLYLFLFFNVCFFLSPKRGTIAVAIWNLITSFIAMICFAVLSGTAEEQLVLFHKGDVVFDSFVSDTPTRMKTAAVIFSFVFVLNAMLLWAAIKEKPAFLTAWMIANLILEISILVFLFEWPPSYSIPKAVWFLRFGLAMCFLRTVYVYMKFLSEPNPPTILVNTLQPDGTIHKGSASINKV